MTESIVINAEIREDVGKGASRRLRRQGKIPAVIYGGHKTPASLMLEHDPLKHASNTESFYSSILELRVPDGRAQKVVVRDVHHHPFRAQIMHIDLMRVSDEEIFRISVPVHYVGESESNAGKSSGVVIQHLVTEVEIAALPQNLPEFLAVDLSGLEVGDVVMMSDIKPPEGVEITALAGDDADDIMIANTTHIKESQGTGASYTEEEEEIEDTEVSIETDIDEPTE